MMHSFLMAGQSNMAGRGHLNEVPVIEDERLFMQRNCKWQPLCEPVNYDRPFAGASLAVSFVYRYIRDFPGETAGLIPCADGGTGIDEWMRGQPLYDNAVFCTGQAMKTGELDAILWHQGEHNSHPGMSDGYAEKLECVLADLRRDLGAFVPVLVGEVPLEWFSADPEVQRHAHRVNDQLKQVAEEMPEVYFVSAKGISSNGDGLHINARSLRIFGERYYEAYKQRRSIFDRDIADKA